jgi:predicted lipoprotein with Yx(FWY)xxD motif
MIDVNTVNCAAPACPTVPGYKISAAGFLTDDKGRTLYQNSQDTDSTVTCNAASGCAPFWPNPPVLDGSAVPGPVGTTTADGKAYPTYKGRPLYYFGGDRNPGQTGGDGDGTFSTCKP